MSSQANYIFYGNASNSEEVSRFINHVLQSNLEVELRGEKKSPICIWGTHGIGKTDLVQQVAESLNYKFAYIAPAQFEEMGDLIGMPKIQNDRTVFSPPEWVPREEGPGILLIDDVNRADDRILRGIMQLLQNYALVSWKLPARWQIILTANPDGGDYSVTPMDNAMLTRMMHITMQFDPKAWAIWAEQNNVDQRCINFVLTYPDLFKGQLSTPRSLVQFFQSIKNIPDFEKELPLIQMLGAACLDEETVSSFIEFVLQKLSKLIDPDAILKSTNFQEEVYLPLQKLVQKEVLRVDILATVVTRLINYLKLNDPLVNAQVIHNIQSFIKIDFLPNDLRLSLLRELTSLNKPTLKEIFNDPEVATLLLERM